MAKNIAADARRYFNTLDEAINAIDPNVESKIVLIKDLALSTAINIDNNKNIIMAAEQAVPLADREVRVLHTKTIPQGISAMLVFDSSSDASENQIEMMKSAEHVGSGQITFAARDSDYEGHKIKKGELLALENGKLSLMGRPNKMKVFKEKIENTKEYDLGEDINFLMK